MSNSNLTMNDPELARLKAELAQAKLAAAQAAEEALRYKLEALEAASHSKAPPPASSAAPPKTAPAKASSAPVKPTPEAKPQTPAKSPSKPTPPAAASDSPSPPAVAPTSAPAASVETPPAAIPQESPKSPDSPTPAAKTPAAKSADSKTPLPTGELPAAAKPESLTEVARQRWSHKSLKARLQAASGFTSSLVVHAVVLILLATWFLPEILPPEVFELVTLPIRDEEVVVEELDVNVSPVEELSAATPSAMGSASAMGPVQDVQTMQMPTHSEVMTTTMDGPMVKVDDITASGVTASQMNAHLGYDLPGDPAAITDNYAQAMDRITQEILTMLEKDKVLIVWLFDESESMKDDQKEIRDRIGKVYEELGLATQSQGDNLWTSVCSYGSTWKMLTKKPTFDLNEIAEAIDKVPEDPTGKEIMCQAVGMSIAYHRKFAQQGHRQLALVLVTDESGEMEDNRKHLEPAIAEAKSARCRCYVLGREAVFGYPYAHMRWKDPSTNLTYWRRINRGPETPEVEQLQTNGFYRRYDAHPSGFGPYEQCRLARETNGIFFLLPSIETNLVRGEKRRYELEAMRPYMPDLCERDEYVTLRSKSVMQTKLWEVINLLNPYDPQRAKHVVMRHDFSLDPADFARQVAVEQEKAKQYFLYLQQCIKEMEDLAPHREREPDPRWRANYDLIYAQLVAYRIRLYEYGTYLETFKTKPKKITNPFGQNKTTNWELRLSGKTLTGDRFKDDMALATKLFKKVVDEHPGTPWAVRASYELKRGYGVDLAEEFYDPRRRTPGVRLPNL